MSIETLDQARPDLLKEWDFSANERVPENVAKSSHLMAHWICVDCDYHWQSSVKNRTQNDNGCPRCSGLVPFVGRTDLNTTHKDLVLKDWDFSANCISPESVSRCSTKTVYWKCENHKEPYPATVLHRTSGGGCTFCSNRRVLEGFNDLLSHHSFVGKIWDFEQNPLGPHQVSYQSHKEIFLKCEKYGHSYRKSIRKVKNSNCPYCTNRQVLKGFNDLKSTHSVLMKEWDFQKNINIDPSGITSGSNLSVSWLCSACGHRWNNSVKNRTVRGDQCRKCNNKKHVSKVEKDFTSFIEEMLKGELIIRNDREILDGKEIDVLIPEISLGIEFNGVFYHSDRFQDTDSHFDKWRIARNKDVNLMTVWEDDWMYSRDNEEKFLRAFLESAYCPVDTKTCSVAVSTKDEYLNFSRDNFEASTFSDAAEIFLEARNSMDEMIAVFAFSTLNEKLRLISYSFSVYPASYIDMVAETILSVSNFKTLSVIVSNDRLEHMIFENSGFTNASQLKIDCKYFHNKRRIDVAPKPDSYRIYDSGNSEYQYSKVS